MTVKGSIAYGPFDRLKYDIMGFFKYIPFLQCSHGVLSMHHSLRGGLTVNGRKISMTGGRGSYSYEFARYEQAPSDVQEAEIAKRAEE